MWARRRIFLAGENLGLRIKWLVCMRGVKQRVFAVGKNILKKYNIPRSNKFIGPEILYTAPSCYKKITNKNTF